MPDDRLIHRRAIRGEKIGALTDFERGVWLAYQLISDDYGVMLFSAVELQRAIWLEHRPRKVVQAGFQRVVDVGLIQTFQAQGRTYVYQQDWQTWQRVKHPRATIEPCPPPDVLLLCDKKTQELFSAHPRKNPAEVRQDFRKVSEEFRTLARAGGRETLTANANGKQGGGEGGTLTERAGAFCTWYSETHERLFRVGYMGTNLDYTKAIQLCEKFTDAQLRDAALVWFGMDDDFATTGTRTIGKFASRVSGCLQTMKAKGLAS